MNKIALLIPHYNEPNGLIKSLNSISQNEAIDVFVIDDGSIKEKINEHEARKAFSANGNIFFKYLIKNIGLENALNEGLKMIVEKENYTFIARLDCGDTCIGNRFEIQEKFLNKNPDIMLVGSKVICVDMKDNFLYNIDYPEKDKEIRKKMYINCMIHHPACMFRIEVLDNIGYYPTKYKIAEDYEFFFNIIKKYKVANIQQYLIKYEINPNGITLTRSKEQVVGRIKIIRDNFYFGFWPIYGLIRNIIIYFIPFAILLKLKILFRK